MSSDRPAPPGSLGVIITPDEAAAWDTLWKWRRFTWNRWRASFRAEVETWCRALEPLLVRRRPAQILDCAAGFGFKALLFSELGYPVVGSDASAQAVDGARALARELGRETEFFQSRYDELPRKTARRFDFAYSDHFDWIGSRDQLLAAAGGIREVLAPGGVFAFGTLDPASPQSLSSAAGDEWRRLSRFEVSAPFEAGGVRLTELHQYERTPDGMVQNRLYLIEENGSFRVETSFVPFLAKWTWRDYQEVLSQAGFGDLQRSTESALHFITATRQD